MTDTMRVSVHRVIFTPAMVFQSLILSGWKLHDTHRSFSTGGTYEVWTHDNENGRGYASIPTNEDYIARFAQETLSSIAKHYNKPELIVYNRLVAGKKIE